MTGPEQQSGQWTSPAAGHVRLGHDDSKRTRRADGVEFTVGDDGPGIPQADRERVLEPFEQGTESAFSAQPGTGVGLSLVKAFAQLHGGDVSVTESPAGGTRVTVELAHPETDSPKAAPGLPIEEDG